LGIRVLGLRDEGLWCNVYRVRPPHALQQGHVGVAASDVVEFRVWNLGYKGLGLIVCDPGLKL
jgi:hypothetical protein